MSDNESPTPTATPPGPETQRQRWAKYGANVALVSVVVVLLGVIAAAIAQQPSMKARLDTTQAGLYSLKPQTKGILKDVKDKVRIVSLYAHTEPVQAAPGEEPVEAFDYATPVADLLEEYQRHSNGKIDVEVIDPTKNPAKVESLITEVTDRYGGEVKQYRDFLNGYGKTEEELRKLLDAEIKAVGAIDAKDLGESNLAQIADVARNQFEETQKALDDLANERKQLLAKKPPDYKGATDGISAELSRLSNLAKEVARLFTAGDPQAAPAAAKYATESAPRYEAISKQAGAITEQIKKLPALKLDDLRQTLTSRQGRNAIVVMGASEMRVVPFDKVWQNDANLRMAVRTGDRKPKPQFHGEQQVTSAILSLTQPKKTKVAFVRGGGPPLTTLGTLFNPRSGPLAFAAAQLRDYNFDILEKDLSGSWAMQQQMQQRGMPTPPEPDDAAIKDAIWIVIVGPAQPGPMGPPANIAPKVAEHLKAGGSALLLFQPQAEDMSPALNEYGIKVRHDAVVMHEPVPPTGPPGDYINQAQRQPWIFIVNEYGNHPLAQPLTSLDAPMVVPLPVSTEPKPGVKQWSLIPLPNEPKSWAETGLDAFLQGEDQPTFDPKTETAGPFFAGAAAQKEQGEGRVVVIGSASFIANDTIAIRDEQAAEQGYRAARFPGCLELLTNSVFWLAKQDTMIAISPAAMDVSRIEPMSKGAQAFWRTGVVWIAPCLLVVAAGGLMYLRRRD